MKVSLKDSAKCEKVLSVALTEDLIRQEYDHFFHSIEREAKVPGFRPGKAPREILARHFAGEAREKVLERLISRSLKEAIQEKQIQFLGHPAIRGVEFSNEKLTYEALLEVPPVIKLGKYKGFSVEKPAVEIKEADLEEALERVRETHAKFVSVEDRPSQMGDFLIADYRCSVDGKEAESRTDDWLELRADEFLKGFSPQLVGLKAGDAKEVRIQFPEKFGRKEWVNQEGVFQVRVKEVKAKQLPPLNDELAKETGEFQTLEELKARLKEQLTQEKQRRAEIDFERALLDALLKENSFEVPKGVVERRLQSLLEEGVRSLYQTGFTKEMVEKQTETLAEKLRPEAERQVRLAFLLEEIGKKEGLLATQPEFEEKYRSLAPRYRQKEEVLRKFYEEHPEAKESLGVQILNEKVIELIKQNAKAGRNS